MFNVPEGKEIKKSIYANVYKFWTKICYLKISYKYMLKTKIILKLVHLGHVSIHINNTIIDYDIEFFLN